MPETISEVMTANPRTLNTTATAKDAAELMREGDIGDVLVVGRNGSIQGIVTDRDIAVRVVAAGADASAIKLEEICTKDVTTLSADGTVDQAISLMQRKAIRRLPIVDHGRLVGVVSLGDLAQQTSPQSTLARISAAPPDEAEDNGAADGRAALRLGQVLPAAAAGAGLAITIDRLAGRSRRGPRYAAAKSLRKAGKKLTEAAENASRGRRRTKAGANRG